LKHWGFSWCVSEGYAIYATDSGLFNLKTTIVRLDTVLAFVSIEFIAILGIGAWIGLTMAKTQPPKPIEQITLNRKRK
jgi:predicted DNA-binding transcriptional regulator